MSSKERVEFLLKNYHDMKSELEAMRFQIVNFSGVTYEESLEALAFASGEGERVQTSEVSDKTAKVALIYRDVADRQNDEALKVLIRRYHEQKSELELLEYCIRLLPYGLSDVITDMYLTRLTWMELCQKYFVAESTVSAYRKKAIREIARLFEASEVIAK